ncbi:hypothetical protein CBL_02930 [Carabus blaptoides fortunei]
MDDLASLEQDEQGPGILTIQDGAPITTVLHEPAAPAPQDHTLVAAAFHDLAQVVADPDEPVARAPRTMQCKDHGSESYRNPNKKLKNGVQYDIKWCCVSCGDKNTPLSIIEVKYQNLERELFLLKGENAAYVKMYEDLQAKYLVAVKEIETLKSSFCSKDANLSNTGKKVENIQLKNVKHVQTDSKTNQVKNSKSRGHSTVNTHQLSNGSSTSFDKSQPSTAHTCTSANGFEQLEKKTPESDSSRNKDEEFTVVQKKKRSSLKPKIGTKPDSTLQSFHKRDGCMYTDLHPRPR